MIANRPGGRLPEVLGATRRMDDAGLIQRM